MPYNNPTPSQSTTLSPAELSREARKLLCLLRDEGDRRLEEKLSGQAYRFVQEKLMELELLEEMGSKGELAVTVSQVHWLRDLWGKFA